MDVAARADRVQQVGKSSELRQLNATSDLLAALQAVAIAEAPTGTADSGGLTGSLLSLAGALPSISMHCCKRVTINNMLYVCPVYYAVRIMLVYTC
jgi:hypothetical protein